MFRSVLINRVQSCSEFKFSGGRRELRSSFVQMVPVLPDLGSGSSAGKVPGIGVQVIGWPVCAPRVCWVDEGIP